PVAFVRSVVGHFGLVAGMLGALVVGKGVAAAVVGRAFGYTRAARWTMWSLTLPQVAATLAAALVPHRTVNASGEQLLDGPLLNWVFVLILTTSIPGPMLTAHFARRLIHEPSDEMPGAGIEAARGVGLGGF